MEGTLIKYFDAPCHLVSVSLLLLRTLVLNIFQEFGPIHFDMYSTPEVLCKDVLQDLGPIVDDMSSTTKVCYEKHFQKNGPMLPVVKCGWGGVYINTSLVSRGDILLTVMTRHESYQLPNVSFFFKVTAPLLANMPAQLVSCAWPQTGQNGGNSADDIPKT